MHRSAIVALVTLLSGIVALSGCTCGSQESRDQAEEELAAGFAAALEGAMEQAAGDPNQVTGHCVNPRTHQCTEYRGNHLVTAETLRTDCADLGGAWGEGACSPAGTVATCTARSMVIRYTAPEEQNPIMPRQEYCQQILQGTFSAGS